MGFGEDLVIDRVKSPVFSGKYGVPLIQLPVISRYWVALSTITAEFSLEKPQLKKGWLQANISAMSK